MNNQKRLGITLCVLAATLGCGGPAADQEVSTLRLAAGDGDGDGPSVPEAVPLSGFEGRILPGEDEAAVLFQLDGKDERWVHAYVVRVTEPKVLHHFVTPAEELAGLHRRIGEEQTLLLEKYGRVTPCTVLSGPIPIPNPEPDPYPGPKGHELLDRAKRALDVGCH